MYAIKDARDVPARQELCKVGYPLHTTPDICILNTDNPYTVISINSQVLREALLADPSYVLFTLGQTQVMFCLLSGLKSKMQTKGGM